MTAKLRRWDYKQGMRALGGPAHVRSMLIHEYNLPADDLPYNNVRMWSARGMVPKDFEPALHDLWHKANPGTEFPTAEAKHAPEPLPENPFGE